MTFFRGVFLFALLMFVMGIVGSRYVVAAIFGGGGPPEPRIIAQAPRDTSTPTETPAATATVAPTATATPRPTVAATSTSTLTPMPTLALPTPTVAHPARKEVNRRVVVRRKARRAAIHHHRQATKPRPTPTVTVLPTPSPTPGIVTLARYWVGSLQAQHGQTISVGYVIDNETGQTARIMLGASIKADNRLSWGASLSDPAHDVVAIVPPGVTTHVRYFTLPSSLRPGSYAVAWGLRDASTGERTALVAAPAAIRVTR